MDCILVLETGHAFRGTSFGATGESFGELVFNTSMVGYQEILSDPSYRGQIVTMTYPMMGNYGVNEADFESSKLHLSGFVVREYCQNPSGPRSSRPLGLLLKERKIIGLADVDTREITRALREHGCVQSVISTEDTSIPSLKEKLLAAPRIEGRDLVIDVGTRRVYRFREKLDRAWYAQSGLPQRKGQAKHKVAILDFGMKTNIARLVAGLGAEVTVFPPDTAAEKITGGGFAGVVLSNGPGDPEGLPYAVETARKVAESLPTFGICLGHQLLGLALGGKIDKLKFGHHGGNHPVQEKSSGKVLITSQNHNYAVRGDSLPPEVGITHVNLNDGTVEGMAHRDLPVFSIQYHPEASPGPHDALHHFSQFFDALEQRGS